VLPEVPVAPEVPLDPLVPDPAVTPVAPDVPVTWVGPDVPGVRVTPAVPAVPVVPVAPTVPVATGFPVPLLPAGETLEPPVVPAAGAPVGTGAPEQPTRLWTELLTTAASEIAGPPEARANPSRPAPAATKVMDARVKRFCIVHFLSIV
jgi:hypothetical protein